MTYITKIEVLIIEDDELSSSHYRNILDSISSKDSSVKINTRTASSVKEGISKCTVTTPDITIVDLHLGDGKGTDVLKSLHREVSVSDVYNIIITGNTEDLTSNINEYNSLGIDKIWVKPLNIDEVTKIFDDAVKMTFQRKRNDRYYSMLQKSYHSMDNSVVGIIITDAKGHIEYVNNAFLSMTGYSLSEVISRSTNILKSGYHDNRFYGEIWEQLTGGDTVNVTFINKRKDGSVYYQESTIMPYTDNEGNITNYIAQTSDITEKRQQNLEFEAIITTLPEVIMIYDKNRICIRMYPNSALGDFNVLQDARGKTPMDMKLLPKHMRESIISVFDEIDNSDHDKFFYHEYELATAGGNRFFEILSKRFNSEKYMTTIRDITDSRVLRQFHKFSTQLSKLATQNDQLVTKYLIKTGSVDEQFRE